MGYVPPKKVRSDVTPEWLIEVTLDLEPEPRVGLVVCVPPVLIQSYQSPLSHVPRFSIVTGRSGRPGASRGVHV